MQVAHCWPPPSLTSQKRHKASLSARHCASLHAWRSSAGPSRCAAGTARVALPLRLAPPLLLLLLLLPSGTAMGPGPGHLRITATLSCTAGITVTCMPAAVMMGPGKMRAQHRHSSSSAQLSSSPHPGSCGSVPGRPPSSLDSVEQAPASVENSPDRQCGTGAMAGFGCYSRAKCSKASTPQGFLKQSCYLAMCPWQRACSWNPSCILQHMPPDNAY
jgi:hypothetical protein